MNVSRIMSFAPNFMGRTNFFKEKSHMQFPYAYMNSGQLADTFELTTKNGEIDPSAQALADKIMEEQPPTISYEVAEAFKEVSPELITEIPREIVLSIDSNYLHAKSEGKGDVVLNNIKKLDEQFSPEEMRQIKEQYKGYKSIRHPFLELMKTEDPKEFLNQANGLLHTSNNIAECGGN